MDIKLHNTLTGNKETFKPIKEGEVSMYNCGPTVYDCVHVGNLRSLVSPASYQKDAYITQFGKAGNVIKEYKFVGLFPIEVSPIEVDWGANDSIEEFSVTFAYQWWESTNPASRATTDSTQAGPSAVQV